MNRKRITDVIRGGDDDDDDDDDGDDDDLGRCTCREFMGVICILLATFLLFVVSSVTAPVITTANNNDTNNDNIIIIIDDNTSNKSLWNYPTDNVAHHTTINANNSSERKRPHRMETAKIITRRKHNEKYKQRHKQRHKQRQHKRSTFILRRLSTGQKRTTLIKFRSLGRGFYRSLSPHKQNHRGEHHHRHHHHRHHHLFHRYPYKQRKTIPYLPYYSYNNGRLYLHHHGHHHHHHHNNHHHHHHNNRHHHPRNTSNLKLPLSSIHFPFNKSNTFKRKIHDGNLSSSSSPSQTASLSSPSLNLINNYSEFEIKRRLKRQQLTRLTRQLLPSLQPKSSSSSSSFRKKKPNRPRPSSSAPPASSSSSTSKPRSKNQKSRTREGNKAIRMSGNIILGGLFPMHEMGQGGQMCGAIKAEKGIQRVEAMLYALDVINSDDTLLPGVKLGCHILDTCLRDTYALEQSLDFIKPYMVDIDDDDDDDDDYRDDDDDDDDDYHNHVKRDRAEEETGGNEFGRHDNGDDDDDDDDKDYLEDVNGRPSAKSGRNTRMVKRGRIESESGKHLDKNRVKYKKLKNETFEAKGNQGRRKDNSCRGGSVVKSKPRVKVQERVAGVIGAAASPVSIMVANMLRLFKIPQISYASTGIELSDKTRFTYFSRVVPPDTFQAQALVDVVLRFNWNYVSTLADEGNYGEKGISAFEDLAQKSGICISKSLKIPREIKEDTISRVVLELNNTSKAKVVVMFVNEDNCRRLVTSASSLSLTERFYWLASDSWGAKAVPVIGQERAAEGTVTVLPERQVVKGFDNYFTKLNPYTNRRNPWFIEFWESYFAYERKICTGYEEITRPRYEQEGVVPFVVDAVYAIGHALHRMIKDTCKDKLFCRAVSPPDGKILLWYIRNTSFIGTTGKLIQFDENGDAKRSYTIYQFQEITPNKYDYIPIGSWTDNKLELHTEHLKWKRKSLTLPKSVCSEPCGEGKIKKTEGQDTCCWVCIQCGPYEIKTGEECIPCPNGTEPDDSKNRCQDLPLEYMSLESPWAIVPAVFASFGILSVLFVFVIFIRYNSTPIIMASGRELCYVIMAGMILCYGMTFVMAAKPNVVTCCMFRLGLGTSLALCYAGLFTKTNRISRIFNRGLKAVVKRPSYTSPRSQLVICFCLVLVQLVASLAWVLVDSPRPAIYYPDRGTVWFRCRSSGTSIAVSLFYNMILVTLCTIYAFKTRKIPENFNEAKYIAFAMYSTCVVWASYVPIYFGSLRGDFRIQISGLCMCVNVSATVNLACLFVPKVYIVLFQPHKNSRQSTSKSGGRPLFSKHANSSALNSLDVTNPTGLAMLIAQGTMKPPKASTTAAASSTASLSVGAVKSTADSSKGTNQDDYEEKIIPDGFMADDVTPEEKRNENSTPVFAIDECSCGVVVDVGGDDDDYGNVGNPGYTGNNSNVNDDNKRQDGADHGDIDGDSTEADDAGQDTNSLRRSIDENIQQDDEPKNETNKNDDKATPTKEPRKENLKLNRDYEAIENVDEIKKKDNAVSGGDGDDGDGDDGDDDDEGDGGDDDDDHGNKFDGGDGINSLKRFPNGSRMHKGKELNEDKSMDVNIMLVADDDDSTEVGDDDDSTEVGDDDDSTDVGADDDNDASVVKIDHPTNDDDDDDDVNEVYSELNERILNNRDNKKGDDDDGGDDDDNNENVVTVRINSNGDDVSYVVVDNKNGKHFNDDKNEDEDEDEDDASKKCSDDDDDDDSSIIIDNDDKKDDETGSTDDDTDNHDQKLKQLDSVDDDKNYDDHELDYRNVQGNESFVEKDKYYSQEGGSLQKEKRLVQTEAMESSSPTSERHLANSKQQHPHSNLPQQYSMQQLNPQQLQQLRQQHQRQLDGHSRPPVLNQFLTDTFDKLTRLINDLSRSTGEENIDQIVSSSSSRLISSQFPSTSLIGNILMTSSMTSPCHQFSSSSARRLPETSIRSFPYQQTYKGSSLTTATTTKPHNNDSRNSCEQENALRFVRFIPEKQYHVDKQNGCHDNPTWHHPLYSTTKTTTDHSKNGVDDDKQLQSFNARSSSQVEDNSNNYRNKLVRRHSLSTVTDNDPIRNSPDSQEHFSRTYSVRDNQWRQCQPSQRSDDKTEVSRHQQQQQIQQHQQIQQQQQIQQHQQIQQQQTRQISKEMSQQQSHSRLEKLRIILRHKQEQHKLHILQQQQRYRRPLSSSSSSPPSSPPSSVLHSPIEEILNDSADLFIA